MNHSKKVFQKAVSLVLALALIASCITVSFSAFAADNLFSVPSSSPAVPLYVNKAIDLNANFRSKPYILQSNQMYRYWKNSPSISKNVKKECSNVIP